MQYRAPSSLSTNKDGVLRRRSSVVYSPQYDADDDREDTELLQRRPTVALVRATPSSPRVYTPLPASTFSPFAVPPNTLPLSSSPPRAPVVRGLGLGLIGSPMADAIQPHSEAQFSTVPLTPRPDASEVLSPCSMSTIPSLPTPMAVSEHALRPDGPHRAASDATTVPPLPTPDFSRAPRFLGLFPRGFSHLSYPGPLFSRPESEPRATNPCNNDDAKTSPLPTPGLRSLIPRGFGNLSWNHVPHRPPSTRSDSESSGGSGTSGASSAVSIDSGHYALIKEIGTTDRFTHKWPRPQSMRTYTADEAREGLLEDGRGPAKDVVEPWTTFKWCLLLSVSTVFVYGSAALVCALMTWFRTWDLADVMYVADNDIVILITLAGSILVFTALVGFSGVLLNSRPILAVYTVLLFPAFLSVVAIGYVGYKRTTFALDQKLNLSWSQYYTPLGRLRIQDALHCCGFYSPLHEATPSTRCFPRTVLPGCKGKLYRFERANLVTVWSTVFSLVPLHLLNVLVALLCANHVTERFGRGITPKRYWLTNGDVVADAEKIRRRVTGIARSEGRARELPCEMGVPDSVEDTVPFLSYEGRQY
ncbi:tetraspanin Tsp2 family [Roridomyces roridus]|uniref:Tetraspanin Tsp2 family n=1 Tax=Roridomyces roridus TaxID=1738132 RepID=A0AAD7CBW9_9AGAR|nr:tetraspanin Tsp2 family [Roridomyces roridus]